MTSLSYLRGDLSKILSDINWLTEIGFSHHLENEYICKIAKDEIAIFIYYGRYSDPTDVLIEIDTAKADRHGNGEPFRYSVFEAALIDKTIENPARSDGYDTAKAGLKLLKQHNQLFDVEYLKKIREKYNASLRNKLPKHLRNLTCNNR